MDKNISADDLKSGLVGFSAAGIGLLGGVVSSILIIPPLAVVTGLCAKGVFDKYCPDHAGKNVADSGALSSLFKINPRLSPKAVQIGALIAGTLVFGVVKPLIDAHKHPTKKSEIIVQTSQRPKASLVQFASTAGPKW